MKKATHRILAALLALCLLFGCAIGASAASKGFGSTVTIRKMPTDTTFIPGVTDPDLSGLELTFKLGGYQKVLKYDDMYKSVFDDVDFEKLTDEEYQRLLKYAESQDSFSVWLNEPDDGPKAGKNTFKLEVSVSSQNENFSRYNIPITFTGVPLLSKVDPAKIGALKPELPNRVNATGMDDKAFTLYSFTPRASGWYAFRSACSGFTRLSDILNSVGLPGLPGLSAVRIDPCAKLFDADGLLIAEGDDQGSSTIVSFDFNFRAQLEAGKTYYLLTRTYGEPASYVVTVNYAGPAFG